MYRRAKQKVYTLLHPEVGHTVLDRVINAFLIGLILLNIVAEMLETEVSLHTHYKNIFHYFDQ